MLTIQVVDAQWRNQFFIFAAVHATPVEFVAFSLFAHAALESAVHSILQIVTLYGDDSLINIATATHFFNLGCRMVLSNLPSRSSQRQRCK